MNRVRICRICGLVKPDADFYPYRRNPCRKCDRQRVKLWAKNNPERVKANSLKYRTSEKGRTKHRINKRIYNKTNSAGWKEKDARYRANLGEGYVRNMLRQMGVLHPNAEQIEAHRRRVRITRARRPIITMTYGTRIQN